MTRRQILATCLAALLCGYGAAVTAAPLSEADRADVARVEAYLNDLRSIKSAFVQLASGGRFAEGTIYLQRPDRMRLAYKKPATVQVYANSTWLIYVDTELEEVSHVPVGSTLAGFLVRDRIALSGDITVTGVARGPRTLTVDIVQTEEPEAGRFSLTFSEAPLTLRKWTVVDAQGVETHVTLVGPEFGVEIPREVFVFDQSKFDRELQ